MTRAIFGVWIAILLSACTRTSDTKHHAGDRDSADNSAVVKTDAHRFHTFTFNLDEMKELITFNAWSIANLSSDTSAVSAANTVPLPDTSGIAISMHYPYQGHDYVVYSANMDQDRSMDATYLGEILNGKIVVRDTIVAMGTSSTRNMPVKIINGIYAYDYSHRVMDGERLVLRSEGSIYIKADTIVVGYRYFNAGK
jgi:hypothetical protein